MEKLSQVLGALGTWCGQNKYLSAIKNSFQNFMPLTIAGALGVLWGNVLVNAQTGLGSLFAPIMALQFLNPAFSAIQFATISCITIGITFGVAQEIGESNGHKGYFTGLVGLTCWLAVTQNVITVDGVTFSGLSTGSLGATGLFTGMIVGIVSIEIFSKLSSIRQLKIKMPDTVPPGVAKSFEVLIPAFLTLTIISLIGLACYIMTGGLYLNDVIKTSIQGPLSGIGATLPGLIVIYLLVQAFWLVGIHGNNMLSAVTESLFTPLILANMEAFANHQPVEHIFNTTFIQMFVTFGGSGIVLALTIAIFLVGKREDNKAVAKLSIVPNMFNINETVVFGIPLVLNPILGIPFIFGPTVSIVVGYLLSAIGFCPKTVLQVPWTTPPVIFGFLATGANIRGAISQLIALFAVVLCYMPFLIIYERYQNKQETQA